MHFSPQNLYNSIFFTTFAVVFPKDVFFGVIVSPLIPCIAMEIASFFSPSSLSSTTFDNSGFCAAYLRTATEKEVIDHRVKLYDCCQYEHSAAKYAAMYIYEETKEVFDHKLRTNVLYDWLKKEFGLRASRGNFYKACRNFDSYTHRK